MAILLKPEDNLAMFCLVDLWLEASILALYQIKLLEVRNITSDVGTFQVSKADTKNTQHVLLFIYQYLLF